MTRRMFTAALVAVPGFGAVKFGEEMKSGDTSILLFPAGESGKGEFGVGVRTSVNASHYLAQVFYMAAVPGIDKEVLLHQESLGPVAGNDGYGATNRNFNCPQDKVQFIRVTFFQRLEEREFR